MSARKGSKFLPYGKSRRLHQRTLRLNYEKRNKKMRRQLLHNGCELGTGLELNDLLVMVAPVAGFLP